MIHKAKRMSLFGLGALISVSLLAGCGGGESGPSGSAAPQQGQPEKTAERPFEGQALTVYMGNLPWTEAIKPYLPEFEKQTGIKLDVQSFFEDQLTQKLTVQFTAGAETPDIFMHRPLQSGRLYVKNGWIESLDKYIQSADAAYDFKDFSENAIQTASVDNQVTAIPIFTEQAILYYRKDLLEQAHVPVPKTLDELYQSAMKMHDPAKELNGFVTRAKRNQIVNGASSFVFSEGGDFVKDGKAVVNSPETVRALELEAKLLKEAGPEGVLNMAWPQAVDLFAQGKVVFMTESNGIHAGVTDPSKSKVSDKVGFALFPAGQAGSVPQNVAPWGLAMNAKSKHKEAAWAFIQWATSKDMVLNTQKKGVPGARNSVWASAEGTSGFPEALGKIITESSKMGKPVNGPDVINVGEARDIVGDIIAKAMTGGDIREAANEANRKLQELIDKEK